MFTQTQQALYDAQRLQHLYTTQAWEKFTSGQSTTDYETRRPDLPPLEQTPTPEVTAVLRQKRTVDFRLPDFDFGLKDENGESKTGTEQGGNIQNQKPGLSEAKVSKIQNALATPLKLRNEIIGVLGLHDETPNRRWTDDEIALIESVSEQMSLAIENARLFNTTQHRAQREALTRQIADKIRSAGNVEEILQTTVAELSKALGVSRAFIDLNADITSPVADNASVDEA